MFPALVRSAESRGSPGAADHGLAPIISDGNCTGSVLDNTPRPPLCSLLLGLIGHHGQNHLILAPASVCSEWASGREGLSSRWSAHSTSSLRLAACGRQRWNRRGAAGLSLPHSGRSGVREIAGSRRFSEVASDALCILVCPLGESAAAQLHCA